MEVEFNALWWSLKVQGPTYFHVMKSCNKLSHAANSHQVPYDIGGKSVF